MINLVPETYSAPPAARRRYIWRSMTMFGLLMIAFTGFHAVGGGPPERFGLNLAMVLLCIGFVLAASFETVVLIRSLDELQQRIHILAWAIGLGAAVTVAFCWDLASTWLPVVMFEPIFTVLIAVTGYYLSLFLVSRHYR
ncbi:MAG: hypothetical protein HLUCCA04_08105 [Oceanicaulis sp. HLUCCA04]|nr:MAG: hypothetical protein HLUCCA04_08105 [Oceanicaulis sp. HLUCCA04]